MVVIQKTLLLLTLVGSVQVSIQSSCGMEFYEQEVNGISYCHKKCPTCPPGFEPITPCFGVIHKLNITVGCQPCKDNMYKEGNGSHWCRTCDHTCPGNLVLTTSCNSTTARRCDCKLGNFFHQSLGCVSCCEKLSLFPHEKEKCKDFIQTCRTDIPMPHLSTTHLTSTLELPSPATTSNPSTFNTGLHTTTDLGHSPTHPFTTILSSKNVPTRKKKEKKDDKTVVIVSSILVGIILFLVVLLIYICKRRVRKSEKQDQLNLVELGHISATNECYANTVSDISEPIAPLLASVESTERPIVRLPSVSADSSMQYQDSGQYVTLKDIQKDDDNWSCAGERREDWGKADSAMTDDDSLSTTSLVQVHQAEITNNNTDFLLVPSLSMPTSALIQINSPVININYNASNPPCAYKKDEIVKSGLNKLAEPNLNNEEFRLTIRKKLVEASPSCDCGKDFPDRNLFSDPDVPSTNDLVTLAEKNQSEEQMDGLTSSFQSLVLPDSFHKPKDFRTLLTQISTYIPEFTIRSFVYWFRLEGRNDIITSFHNKYHVSHEDG